MAKCIRTPLPSRRHTSEQSIHSVEGEGGDRKRNREASYVGNGTESEDDESEPSGEGMEMGTSKVEEYCTKPQSSSSSSEGRSRQRAYTHRNKRRYSSQA